VPNHRVTRRSSGLVGLFLVLALVATACGGNKSDGSSTATTTAGTDTTVGSKDGAPVGFNEADFEGTPRQGGAITFGVESQTASLDPAGNLAQPSDVDMALAIYDPLIAYDDKGNLAPSLATKWENSPDLKTWTITVRSDVKFQDGTPFNADSVTKQFERFKAPATACTCKEQVAPVKSVTTKSATEVVFVLDTPNAFWSSTLAGILGLIASPTATAKWGKDYARHPVGTGPFSLPSYDAQVLKRNPNYWQKDANGVQLPYLDQITVKPIADATVRLSSLESGDVDIVQTADTGNIVSVVKSKSTTLKVQKITGSSSTIVLFNMKKAPFNDVRIRQAFAYALDRAQINLVQYEGSRQPAYGPFPPDSPYYVDAKAPHFDLAKAKQLVAAAKADGVPTSYQAVCIPTGESRKILGLVKEQMAKAGLTQTNEFLDQGTLVNQVFTKTGNYQASCFRSPQIANADGLYNSLVTGQSTNVMFYSNAKVDKALNDIRLTTDNARQVSDLKDVQLQIAKDVPTIPLLYDLFGNIYSTKVSGLPVPEPWSLGAIKFTTLYLKK